MSYPGGMPPGASGAAAAAHIAQAIKASGAIVRVAPHDFETILSRVDEPLVVTTEGGFFTTNYQYLTAYKGLIFFAKTHTPLNLPAKAEMIRAEKIWIPG
jgi:hypothetical protein